MARIGHDFTAFQTHVVQQAELDVSRFPIEQALLFLEREAEYKSEDPTLPGLFVYQFEAISRNRLGYNQGLAAMAEDLLDPDEWRDEIVALRVRLGDVDFADLIFVRSAYDVTDQRRRNPDFTPKFPILFGEKEGKIARANRGRDPLHPVRGAGAAARRSRGPPAPPPRRGRGPNRPARAARPAARVPLQGSRGRGPPGHQPQPIRSQARRHRRPPPPAGVSTASIDGTSDHSVMKDPTMTRWKTRVLSHFKFGIPNL